MVWQDMSCANNQLGTSLSIQLYCSILATTECHEELAPVIAEISVMVGLDLKDDCFSSAFGVGIAPLLMTFAFDDNKLPYRVLLWSWEIRARKERLIWDKR